MTSQEGLVSGIVSAIRRFQPNNSDNQRYDDTRRILLDAYPLIASLHKIVHLLPSVDNVEAGLQKTLEAAVEAVNATGGSLLFHDADTRELCFRHVVGGTEKHSRSSVSGCSGNGCRTTPGSQDRFSRVRKPLIVHDVDEHDQHDKTTDEEYGYDTRSLATVPIAVPGGAAIGVMQLVNKQDGTFTEDDLLVLDIIGSICAMTLALHSATVPA